MKSLLRACLLVVPLAAGAPRIQEDTPRDREIRLPDGKSQKEAILKAEHEKTLKDAAQLIDLAESLKEELEKNDRHVLSLSSLKKTEDIEKLARRIRGRLKR